MISFIVLVASLLINTLSYCSAENVYCVTPTATSCSSCPHNTHCATLSEYAQEAELYFTSNTSMVFLPGDHVLDRNITVANVARLTMRGEFSSDSTTVVRNGSVGFSFTNMVNFNIYSLAFTSYNRSRSYGSHPATSALLLKHSCAKLVNCSFHGNLGTALAVNNTNVVLVKNNFTHNQCRCKSFSEVGEVGCGLIAISSTLTFSGNTSFLKNNQTASYPTYTFYCGGAIWAFASSLHFNGVNNFIGNSANGVKSVGGAIYAHSDTTLSFTGTSNFSHNSAELNGGAIDAFYNVTVTFNGINTFFDNSAQYNGGGAIYAETNSSLIFNGISDFNYNSADYEGGVLNAKDNSQLSFIGTSDFSHNSADYGGAIDARDNVVLTFSGTNNFFNNSANSVSGGGIFAVSNIILTFIGMTNFSHNSAERYGGAIDVYDNVVLSFSRTNSFINNLANNGGGVIYAGSNTTVNFIGTSDFSHNSAKQYGGAIDAYDNVVLTFIGTNNFINNFVNNISGGAIYSGLKIFLSFTGNSSFSSNSAMHGGAIFAYESTLRFDGNISFTKNGHNTGDSRGGAIYLYISSSLTIMPNTTVYWENNHANLGGAIYVYDANPHIYCTRYKSKEKCFFQLPGQNLSNGIDVQFVFKNNYADTAGSVLYGGAIDNCELIGLESNSSGEVFDMLFQYERDNKASSISSHPFRICPCQNNLPDCSQSNITLSLLPGETQYQVSMATVGQRNGIVPANTTSMDKCILKCPQYTQRTSKTCTTLKYTMDPELSVSLELYADGPCSTLGDKLVLQLIGTQSCSVGPQNNSMFCICIQTFQKDGINHCSTTNGLVQIKRDSNETFWVGFNLSYEPGLIVHPYCPFDYCSNKKVVFSLNNTNMQCAHNRSGVLCGHCKEGYSLELGTFQCRECNNDNLALLVPFAMMGVALVFLLLVCKLTVATGTLSGLVFYANIVGANRTMFLPAESTDAFLPQEFTNALYIFITWINLDFGVQACFYNGMNAYSKTWLQFVFPVYLWLLVGLMILVSHFSQMFANLLGRNPVSVLATLILLSYAKILHTIITAVYITYLEYPNGNRVVWLYDANIDYFSRERIPLFLVAVLVFLFLFLPYTLLLLFGQWLQAISHLRLFSWVNSARLKPFTDAYHAPYKGKHRYWPGLLLVLRFVLLLVFAFNSQQDPNINLLAILVGAGVLQLWAWVSGGVYKNWCLDALEGSFVLNLTILGAATHYVSHSGGNQLAVGYTSVIIALATFIGILFYHIFQQLRHTKLWKKVPKLNPKFKKPNKKPNTKQAEDNLRNFAKDTSESVNFDQLREPLLDDPQKPTHSVV